MGGANVITRMARGSSGLRMALGTSNRRPSPTPAAIPRHGHPAPPVDNLGTADQGHVPGLTRQVQAGLAGGVAALYPDLPQKTALSPATVSHFAASDTDPSDGPTPLIAVRTPALRVPIRRVAGVPMS